VVLRSTPPPIATPLKRRPFVPYFWVQYCESWARAAEAKSSVAAAITIMVPGRIIPPVARDSRENRSVSFTI
jgi:hypothetical protein